MANPYHYQAKKVTVCGHKKIGLPYDEHVYSSILESKMAVILIKNGIQFEPHKSFAVYDKHGNAFTYELDFLFNRPRKFGFMNQWVMGIEVKGVLRYNDLKRKDALEYCHNVPIFIVTESIIELWNTEGLWKEECGYKNGGSNVV